MQASTLWWQEPSSSSSSAGDVSLDQVQAAASTCAAAAEAVQEASGVQSAEEMQASTLWWQEPSSSSSSAGDVSLDQVQPDASTSVSAAEAVQEASFINSAEEMWASTLSWQKLSSACDVSLDQVQAAASITADAPVQAMTEDEMSFMDLLKPIECSLPLQCEEPISLKEVAMSSGYTKEFIASSVSPQESITMETWALTEPQDTEAKSSDSHHLCDSLDSAGIASGIPKRIQELEKQAPQLPKSQKAHKDRWKIPSIAEHRVIGAGVRRLHQELVCKKKDKGLDLLELPKRLDGSFRVMQASFFRRLLEGQLEVKGCLESDVSAAYMDLKHLSLEQLVAVRAQSVDPISESQSHSAHSNFLDSLDAYLAEKLAGRLLREESAAPSHMKILGRRLILALGARELLHEGWGSSDSSDSSFLPDFWALELEAVAWHGHAAALFHADELWVELPGGSGPDRRAWPRATSAKSVAVVNDISAGAGRAKRLQWEITAVEPEDVLSAVVPADLGGHQQQQLVKALSARFSKQEGIPSVPRPLTSSRLGFLAGGDSEERRQRPSLAFLHGRVKQSVARIDEKC